MGAGPGLEAFLGRWQLTRVIDDARAGLTGRLDGIATYTAQPEGLLYAEVGRLRYGDRPAMEARRAYDWRAGPRGIEVWFDDGRPFHTIGPGLCPAVTHDCPPDVYAGAYDFTTWPAWQVSWQVSGPSKDYRMTSSYRPAD